MYYETTRKFSYLLIFAGIVLVILGLWQYMPREISSETPYNVFMSVTTKKVIFPILGIILTVIGITFLKFVREVENDSLLLREELSRLSKMIEKDKNGSL